MKLREHPGLSNWPPDWLSTSGSKTQLRGEVGMLINVTQPGIDPISMIYLTVECEGKSYMGTLLCKDAATCRAIHDLLLEHIGRPFKEIADMEIPSP